jgi:hypothetical protein
LAKKRSKIKRNYYLIDQDEVESERAKVEQITKELKRCEVELETIPLLRAQVKTPSSFTPKNYNLLCG